MYLVKVEKYTQPEAPHGPYGPHTVDRFEMVRESDVADFLIGLMEDAGGRFSGMEDWSLETCRDWILGALEEEQDKDFHLGGAEWTHVTLRTGDPRETDETRQPPATAEIRGDDGEQVEVDLMKQTVEPVSTLHAWRKAHSVGIDRALDLFATTGALGRSAPRGDTDNRRVEWLAGGAGGPSGIITLFYTPKATLEFSDLALDDADRVVAAWLTTCDRSLYPPREGGPAKLRDQVADAWYEIAPCGEIYQFHPDKHYSNGVAARLNEHGYVSVLRLPPLTVPHATALLALATDPSAPFPSVPTPAAVCGLDELPF